MKIYVKVIFKVRFSLSSLLSYYAAASYAQVIPLTKTFFHCAKLQDTACCMQSDSHLVKKCTLCASVYLSVHFFVDFSQSLCLSWRAMIHWKINSDLEIISVEMSFKKKS